MRRRARAVSIVLSVLAVLVGLVPAIGAAGEHVVAEGVGTSFGLTTGGGEKLVVVGPETGLTRYHKGKQKQLSTQPGLTDAVRRNGNTYYATLGEAPEEALEAGSKVLEVKKNKVKEIADLLAFETDVNPAGGPVESNPFDIELLDKKTMLVADAAGNDLLMVTKDGAVDWVATFPAQLVSTAHLDGIIPDLPPLLSAEPVPTSVAVDDGWYYVGELSGFPSAPGASRVWRIPAGTLNAVCVDPGPGEAPVDPCEVVARGFTSIIDLAIGPDGELLVVELSESGWLIVEIAAGGAPLPVLPGTVNAVDTATGGSAEVASLELPTAVAVTKKGAVYATEFALDPALARVVRIA